MTISRTMHCGSSGRLGSLVMPLRLSVLSRACEVEISVWRTTWRDMRMHMRVMKPCLAIIALMALDGVGQPVWAAAAEAGSNMVPARSMLTMGGIASTPARKVSPRFGGTNLPAPPMQQAPWTPPPTSLPSNYVSATRALFKAGMADPRGCEYREIEVGTGDVWRGDGGVVSTHGSVAAEKRNTTIRHWLERLGVPGRVGG